MLSQFFRDTDLSQSPETVAIEFMRAYAGIILKIPPMPDVERIARNRHIADSLSNDPSAANVRRLEDLYGVAKRAIAKSFSKSTGTGLKDVRNRK